MKGKFAACFALPLSAVLSVVLFAQSGVSTRDGVYTADQAGQGQVLFTEKCAMCHGPALQGAGQNPPLAGPDFLQNWSGQTLGDLYTQIKTTMPVTQPGSLKSDEVVQLMAYILQMNKFPAGKSALPVIPDGLKAIHIEAPAGSQ